MRSREPSELKIKKEKTNEDIACSTATYFNDPFTTSCQENIPKSNKVIPDIH
jgi:hypothetical protein